MLQNQSSNKFSSIIGIILLIAVIGFTVFINFFVEEPIEPTEEIEEEKAETTKEYLVLDSTVLANLWKLENLKTKVNVYKNRQKTFMSIDKTLGMSDYNPLKDANYDKMPDSIKQMFEQVYSNNSSESEFIISYGVLAFEHASHSNEDDEITLETVKVISFNDIHSDSVKLLEIGNIILNYQIESIITQPQQGNFTKIELKDGRQVILVKDNTEIAESNYKGFFAEVESLNDSTKLILPKIK